MPRDHRGRKTGDNHSSSPRRSECPDCGETFPTKDMIMVRGRHPVTAEPGTGPAYPVCEDCMSDREDISRTDDIAFRQRYQ